MSFRVLCSFVKVNGPYTIKYSVLFLWLSPALKIQKPLVPNLSPAWKALKAVFKFKKVTSKQQLIAIWAIIKQDKNILRELYSSRAKVEEAVTSLDLLVYDQGCFRINSLNIRVYLLRLLKIESDTE